MGISAAQAVANARAHIVSRQLPQGMCLNFVWRMFGSLNSTGYAAGTLSSAMTAWNGSKHKRGPEVPIPIGAPVYFGVSPTRTDRNKGAGDVTIHVGGGILACTDASGANTGYMTIAARAKQTQRPFIGHTLDFGGRDIDFGVTVIPTNDGQEVVVPARPQEDTLYFTSATNGVGYGLLNGRLIGFRSAFDQELFMRLATNTRNQFLPGEIDTMNGYLAQANAETARAVWDYGIPGYNGEHQARARLAGIDEKATDVSEEARKTIVDAVVAGLAAGIKVDAKATVDVPAIAEAVADKLAGRLQS